MNKIYVLDTSAIVEDPTIVYSFKDSQIIIPFVILEELDKLKSYNSEVAKNARSAIKILDKIFENSNDNVDINSNSKIKVDFDFEKDLIGDMTYGDNQIIGCAYKINKLSKKQVTIVTNDIGLKIKAKSVGLYAESMQSKISLLDIYPYLTISSDFELGSKLQSYGRCEDSLGVETNSFVLFDDGMDKAYGLSRKMPNGDLKLIRQNNPWNLSPKNKDQACLIELILDKSVELVTSIGIAGSGKTLCALACGLEAVLNQKAYDKLIIFRPISTVGEGIGFLPGTENEKTEPYFDAIMDSMEFLFNGNKNHTWKKDLEMYKTKGKIEFDIIAFARGRSIPNALIIVDEAQNFSEHEIKTLLTRAGTNSKIVLLGDISQIDADKLNIMTNGLTKVIKSFKGSKIYGHVTMTKGERSRLATEAVNRL